MNESIEATGQVICQILRDRLSNVQDGVKFYFQSIQPESIAHAVSLIETDPILKDVVELHLSESVFSSLGVSTEYLTTGAVGDYRNEELQSGKKIMLLGPPNESEWDTIHMMKQFGDEFIRSSAMAWVRVFAPATMDDVRKKWWGAALQGLNSLAFADTDQFALYVYRTSLLLNQGKLLTESLGTCLPALRLPCHSGLFSINENLRGQASKWKAKFLEHKRKAQCYLLKKNRNDDCIERDSLDAALTEYLAKPEPNIALADCFRAFIKAEYGWTDASASIAQYEWNVVSPAFFEKVASKAAQNLGSDTIALFDGRQEMRDLTEDERTVLKQLSESRGKGDPTEQEKAFFKSNYREIQADQPLFSRWESYILEKSVEDHDFIGGLIRCLRILSPKTGSDKWQMVVKAKAVKPKDLYQISEDVGLYFATRYGGLSALLSGSVKFVGFDSIFDYPKLIAQWKNDKKTQKKLRTGRPTKDSCKLVFYVELESDNNRQIKLVWRFNPESLAANLRADMTRLSVAANPFVATSVSRETSGRRALPLDLADISCLQPAYGHTAGTLVPPTDKLKSVSVIVKLKSILTAAVEARHLSLELKQAILSAHDAFVASYKDALGAFLEVGLFSHDKVEKAAVDYGEMLNTAAAAKIPDIILGQSLPLLLSGATVEVETYGPLSQPVVIIPPWHPLRLLAATSKAKQFAELAKDITSGSATMSDLDGELLFRDATEWLNHVYYPEVVLGGPQGCLPQLLSVCQYLQDYSVHELPVKDKEFDTPTDVNPRASAQQIGTIVGHYLDLQPHERDNLSVVLFDCDSEQLPGAVVDQIRTLSEDEEQDAMCQVLLAHSNKTKLRALYRTLSKAGESVDDFNSSEATRDFMARLRINIMVAENGKASHNLPQPYDIVFAESTISRHASQSWDIITIHEASPISVKPSAWSRRKPMSSGAINSAVYLVSPSAPKPVWQYLKAIACAVDPEQARTVPVGKCRVPILALGLTEKAVGQLLDSMHSLGNWVVNYDELLHRKLLENKDIRIIRYKQTTTQGKNLIISSRAKDGMLRTELNRLSSRLLPGLTESQYIDFAGRLIQEANSISGNLVLRAIRRSDNAKELMGLVLSKYLVCSELGGERYPGWFLLDDYADWLGEDEHQIADILCLCPGSDSAGNPFLDIVVTEAKFIENASVRAKLSESRNQLKQSLSRIERGLHASGRPLDRPIWLARISDMIVDGIDAPAVAGFDAAEWRNIIRSGECDIRIKGYSHVFDCGPDQIERGGSSNISETSNGTQEVFSLHQTCSHMRAFFEGSDPHREKPRKAHVSETEGSSGIAHSDTPVPIETKKQNQETIAFHVKDLSADGDASVTNAEIDDLPLKSDPLIDILNEPVSHFELDAATSEWVEQTTVATRKALISYNMPAELVTQPILTPNSLLLSFKGSDKLTVNDIEKKRSEILTTHGLKVVAIRPLAGSVRVYIERPQRQIVPLRSVWKSWPPTVGETGNTNLLIAIREEDSSPVYLNPVEQSPHTLVAGTSGSGKSVLMQTLLLGIMATNSPQQAKIVLIDPKMGNDYGPLRRMPHIGEIITTPENGIVAMTELVAEMERRYRLLSEHDANNINLYNQKSATPLPYIWLIHDEFAQWMQREEYRNDVVQIGNQLATMARAAGIFLVFAAQRPSVDVMPLQMRDNLDNRLILRVAEGGKGGGPSQFCLGEAGAEKLLMRGQMLAKLGGEDPVLCQVPFASIDEIKVICEALLSRYSNA